MPEIIGLRVDHTSYELATRQICAWAQKSESRYVCIANVHMVMEAYDSLNLQMGINEADLVTPDGMPLVWTLRQLGKKDQTRVYGPTLTSHLLAAAEEQNLPVGFYGGAPDTLEKLSNNLKQKYPRLQVKYLFSPPFRELTEQEDAGIIKAIQDSGVRILFVGLGCPKQEHWMIAHRGQFKAVMLGVGAAFDFIAGEKSQAPSWMQRVGLEWVYRLFQEPRRLARRYLYHNPRFIFLVARQLLT